VDRWGVSLDAEGDAVTEILDTGTLSLTYARRAERQHPPGSHRPTEFR
jgi:hypothetical protein